MHKALDLTGKSFGRYVVLLREKNTPNGRTRWLCRCSCGTEKIVVGSDLTSGHTKSCGCLNLENVRKMHVKHGKTRTKVYNTWLNMKRRCYDKTNIGFRLYGERGISVCERWLESFENFYADMGDPPSSKHSLDRQNNNGNYEPNNCKWVTGSEQNNNTRVNRLITFNGQTKTVAQWAEHAGIKMATMHVRFNRWSISDAINKPLQR